MLKSVTKVLLVATLMISLTGCSNMSRRDRGTLLGAGVGAAAGYAATGNATGAAVGAVGGGYIGNRMSR